MNLPWYKDGLKFSCTQCGKCCTGAPGFVWVEESEMHAIAKYLGISFEDFKRQYTRKVNDQYTLLERPKNYDCVFLKNRLCQIYPVRPKHCQKFPWWPSNLASVEDWKETAERCEGIDHPNAPLISLKEIEQHLE